MEPSNDLVLASHRSRFRAPATGEKSGATRYLRDPPLAAIPNRVCVGRPGQGARGSGLSWARREHVPDRSQTVTWIGQFGKRGNASKASVLGELYAASSQEALRHMNEYRPRMPSERWTPIASFVQDAVAVAAPQTSYTSQRIFMVLALFVDWAVNSAGLPLNAKVLFRRETIELFIANPPSPLGEGTLRNYRSMILRVSEVLLPEHNTKAMKPLNGRTSVAPYSESEIEAFRRWARGQATRLRERRAMAMLSFCGGAGMRALEVLELRCGDVVVDQSGVLVHVHSPTPRIVPMLGEWETFARFAVKDLADTDLVFGEASHSSRRNLMSRFVESSTGQARPRSDRLRATWIVKHLAAGTPMKALMQAAGVQKFENLARHLQYVPDLNTPEYRRVLRMEVRA